jgi:hypothetical protein
MRSNAGVAALAAGGDGLEIGAAMASGALAAYFAPGSGAAGVDTGGSGWAIGGNRGSV